MKRYIAIILLLFVAGCDSCIANDCISNCNYRLCSTFAPVTCSEPQHERCMDACVKVNERKQK